MNERYDSKKSTLFAIWKEPALRTLCAELLCIEKQYGVLDWSNRVEIGAHIRTIQRESPYRWERDRKDVFRSIDRYAGLLEEYRSQDISVIGAWESMYPQKLLKHEEYPLFIFVQGDASIFREQSSVAIVGARNACRKAYSIQKRLGNIFAEHGFVVVSGLAKGLDAAAHRGCLEVSGRTIAVLAHGLAIPPYPKENQGLAQEIIQNNGCLLSVYEPSTNPSRVRFLERNRLQVELSQGVVFTGGKMHGGTAHTIGYARSRAKPIGFFYHTKIQWSPKELNQALHQKKEGIMLLDRASVEGFMRLLCG